MSKEEPFTDTYVLVTEYDVNVAIKGEPFYETYEKSFHVEKARGGWCVVDAEGDDIANCPTYAAALAVLHCLEYAPAHKQPEERVPANGTPYPDEVAP